MRNILKNFYFLIIGLFYNKKRFLAYEQKYLLLPGCTDRSLGAEYVRGNLDTIDNPLNFYYERLYNTIIDKVSSKSPYSIVRASDGEAFFLQKKLVGNGPRRHYTKKGNLVDEDVAPFREGLLACDSRHIEMYKSNRRRFFSVYKKNIFSDIPFECIYALIASRKLLRENLRIGIIGSEKKIAIIKRLLKSAEYRAYIEREAFEDYISVPERGTSNNAEALGSIIGTQLKNDIDIYLVGIGISKLVILPLLTKKNKAVFIDVGAGISALAGLVSHSRPYFASWTNFKIQDFDYSDVDIMDVNMNESKTVIV